MADDSIANPELGARVALFDNIFKFVEGVAFVFWMLYEFLGYKVLLYLAIVFCLAGLFYLLGHKILKRPAFIVATWIVYAGICVLLFQGRPESKSPNFTLRLIVGGSNADLPLTNDFLVTSS